MPPVYADPGITSTMCGAFLMLQTPWEYSGLDATGVDGKCSQAGLVGCTMQRLEQFRRMLNKILTNKLFKVAERCDS